MKLNKLEEQLKCRARIVGGVFLLEPIDALHFVELCRLGNMHIAGIEGFRVYEDGRIQPRQEDSVDFGSATSSSCRLAREFLEKRLDEELWFEIVIDG